MWKFSLVILLSAVLVFPGISGYLFDAKALEESNNGGSVTPGETHVTDTTSDSEFSEDGITDPDKSNENLGQSKSNNKETSNEMRQQKKIQRLQTQIGGSDTIVSKKDKVSILAVNNAPAISSITASPNPAITADTVNLKAQVTDENPGSLSFKWAQTGGPKISLKGGNTASPRFVVPKLASPSWVVLDLITTDDGGLSDKKSIQVRVSSGRAPVIDSIVASPNRVIPGDAVTITAKVTDEHPNSLSYKWSQTSGPSVILKGSSTSSPSFVAPKIPASTSQIRFLLVVTDDSNQVVSKAFTLTISLGSPPVIISIAASPNPALSGDTVAIKAQVSDEHPKSLEYLWSQVSGPSVVLKGRTTASPSFIVPTLPAGVSNPVVLSLRVVDDTVQFTFGRVEIKIFPSLPPIINTITATPNPALSGDIVTIKAQVTDEKPSSLSYKWSQTSGPTTTLKGTNTASPSFSAPKVISSSTLVFNLLVTDEFKQSHTKAVQVLVLPNNAPVINSITASPLVGTTGETVTIKTQISDERPNSLSFKWEQIIGPIVQLNSANTGSPSFVVPTLTQPATLILILTVTDDYGQSASKDIELTVEPPNNAPVIKSITFFPTSPQSGDRVALNPQIFDEHPNSLSLKWEQTAGPSVALNGGTFIAPQVTSDTNLSFKLTITDDLGQTDSKTVDISVKPSVSANNPPQVQAQSVTAVSGIAKQITLLASDPDTGDTLTFSIVNGLQQGTLTSIDSQGKTTYTSSSGFSGPDSFTFKVTDNHGTDSNVETVSIIVEQQPPQNNPPQAADQTVFIHRETGTFGLEAFDPDAIDTLSYTVTDPPEHITIEINSIGEVSYTKNDIEYIGPDIFNYKAIDNHGAESNIATVNVNIAGD